MGLSNERYTALIIFAIIGGLSIIYFTYKLLRKNTNIRSKNSTRARSFLIILLVVGGLIYWISGFFSDVPDNIVNNLSVISLGFSYFSLAISLSQQDLSDKSIKNIEKKLDNLSKK